MSGGLGAAQSQHPEEITVTGDTSPVNLQLRIDRAEDDLLGLYNELVDEDIQVECEYETVLGSRIKRRICQTSAQKEALTTTAVMSFYGIELGATPALVSSSLEFQRTMRELIDTNPELKAAADRLTELMIEQAEQNHGNQ